MSFEPCPKCGRGGLGYEPIEIPITPIFDYSLSTTTTSNYCSKCGTSLWTTCFSCHGTGKSYTIPMFDMSPSYCSHCGRSLKKKVDNKCSSCGGKGKTKNTCCCI